MLGLLIAGAAVGTIITSSISIYNWLKYRQIEKYLKAKHPEDFPGDFL